VSRYAIFAVMLWFLFTENRYLHLLTLGQLWVPKKKKQNLLSKH
jgi:hypothetical protein